MCRTLLFILPWFAFNLCMLARHRHNVVSAVSVWCAEQDRLEVRRETNEQDKHLDVISDALNDLQRIGEVRVGGHVPTST